MNEITCDNHPDRLAVCIEGGVNLCEECEKEEEESCEICGADCWQDDVTDGLCRNCRNRIAKEDEENVRINHRDEILEDGRLFSGNP